jgi:sugar/nucleoside kinase (ribokinase family)
MSYDVFGMCNPLYDITVEISDAILEEIGREIGTQKGGMFLIDEEKQRALVAKTYEHIVDTASGGSGANTMTGLALLGGKACYAGKIGNDEHGTLYASKLRERQVTISVNRGEGTTGICVVMLTPDAERTMCTFLGISRELGPEDVDVEAIRASKYLYVTGFLWDTESQKAAVLHAMRTARAAGVKVALSLSDPFCVNRHKEDFLAIAREYVDLLIGNHEEAQHLTDTQSPYDAIQTMASLCETAVVTMGGRGALLRHRETLVEIPAYKVEVVDTNGAGDMYAAGILYGLTHGLSLEQTGRLAGYAAAQVVAKLGPRLDNLDQDVLNQILTD